MNNQKVEKVIQEYPSPTQITCFKDLVRQVVQIINSENVESSNRNQKKEASQLEYIEVDEDCYYIGYTTDSIPNGVGMFVFSDDKTHVGVYHMGMLDGFAIIDFENNDRYRGLVKDDKFNGLGYMYNFKQKGYFMGQFLNGKSQTKLIPGPHSVQNQN